MDYNTFLASKRTSKELCGFKAKFFPEEMKPFQKHLTEWAIRLGKAAIFASCGLGKSICALTVCENVLRYKKRTGRALIFCPLAVAHHFEREADKFGMKATKTSGKLYDGINVTNYHRLDNFSPRDFDIVVCDESSVLKSGERKWSKGITAFMSQVNYRLLCTATPAPNDYMELGSSSEALGVMKRNQMLSMFFTNGEETTQQWTLKGHAKKRFWQWMATWARAVRKPSDLGEQFDDEGYILPELRIHKYILPGDDAGKNGFLFAPAAITLNEQRKVCREMLRPRCEKMVSLVTSKGQCFILCHLNLEADLLEKMIPDAVQVSGSMSDDLKEERLNGFALGQIRVLISKPKIAGWGLNLQNCNQVIYVPSWSFESWFQSIRRCWRYGQKHPVDCHMVCTEGERLVLEGLLEKERQSEEMYSGLIREMNPYQVGSKREMVNGYVPMELPGWLKT